MKTLPACFPLSNSTLLCTKPLSSSEQEKKCHEVATRIQRLLDAPPFLDPAPLFLACLSPDQIQHLSDVATAVKAQREAFRDSVIHEMNELEQLHQSHPEFRLSPYLSEAQMLRVKNLCGTSKGVLALLS